jgi:hypothetical protein
MFIAQLLTLLVAFQPNPPAQPAAPAKQPGPYASNGVTKVDINLPALKVFCDGKQNYLKRYLEASPRWRVGIERIGDQDKIVAYRRVESRITLNGYVGSSEQTRVGVIFADKPPEPDFMSPCMTQAAPDAGPTNVAVCGYRAIPSQRIAHLYVGTAGLWLAIVETDKIGTLPKTPGLLEEVQTEFDAVRKATQANNPLSALSKGETHKGAPSLTVDDQEKETLHLEAWVNPGEPGVTEVRVKSGDGTKDLTISHAHLYARECVGYSQDTEELFYANSLIFINETATGWNSKHDVLFQLWFKPDSGGPARKLVEHRQTISGYER